MIGPDAIKSIFQITHNPFRNSVVNIQNASANSLSHKFAVAYAIEEMTKVLTRRNVRIALWIYQFHVLSKNFDSVGFLHRETCKMDISRVTLKSLR